MSKRDRVKEIVDRRKRKTDSENLTEAGSHILVLFDTYEKQKFDLLHKRESTHELYKYIPVALVAIVQNYFQALIAKLINFEGNEAYRTNAKNLNVSLNLAEALAIGGRTITVGEFVAHNISINRIEDAYRAMSTLVGFDFRKRIAEVVKRDGPPLSDRHYVTLANMFEKRHIICHEVPRSIEITNHEAFEFIMETHGLVHGADAVVFDLESYRIAPPRFG